MNIIKKTAIATIAIIAVGMIDYARADDSNPINQSKAYSVYYKTYEQNHDARAALAACKIWAQKVHRTEVSNTPLPSGYYPENFGAGVSLKITSFEVNLRTGKDARDAGCMYAKGGIAISDKAGNPIATQPTE